MSNKKQYSDQELISMIKKGGIYLGKAHLSISKEYKKDIFYKLKNMGIKYEKYEEIYSESVINLMLKIMEEEFEINTTIKAYLIGIVKNIGYKEFRKTSRRMIDIEELEIKEKSNPEEICLTEERKKELESFFNIIFEKLGKTCLEMWKMKIYEGKKDKEIAEVFQKKYKKYGSAKSVKSKRSQCKTEGKKIVNSDELLRKKLSGFLS